jgi:hypothetical protein
MGRKLGLSASFGLLLGIGVIFWLDSTVAPGGQPLDRYGKAAIIAVSTAACTVIGAVIGHFRGR